MVLNIGVQCSSYNLQAKDRCHFLTMTLNMYLQMHLWPPSVCRKCLNAKLSKLNFYSGAFILTHNIQLLVARFVRVLFTIPANDIMKYSVLNC